MLGFHQATVTDIREMIDWLCSGVPEHNYKVEHLTTNAISRFRELKIEPPTPEQVERLVRSAIHSYEERFFSATFSKLPLNTIREIDVLLGDSISVAEGTEVGNDAEQLGQSDFSTLKTDPGRIGLESILKEMTKLQRVRQLNLPVDLFSNISPKLLEQYRQRVATEPLRELRRHPAPIRYTLMAVFGWLRTQEITDNLVELLIQIVHGISARAQQRVEKELLSDFKRVSGKTGLLFQLAEAALDHPEGIVKNVLYPVVGEQTLKDLVKEFNSSGTAYRQKVHTIVRSSYSNHYRRMMTPLLEIW